MVAEYYDEIIFTDPLEKFYNMLMMYTPEGGGKRSDANSSVAKVESQFAVSDLVLRCILCNACTGILSCV